MTSVLDSAGSSRVLDPIDRSAEILLVFLSTFPVVLPFVFIEIAAVVITHGG